MFRMFCRSVALSAIRTIVSANRRLLIRVLATSTHIPESARLVVSSFIKTLKNMGEATHPCLSPYS